MLSALLLAAALTAASPEATPQTPAITLHPVEQGIIDQTNLERQRHGLQPLKIDAGLMQSARRHCAWMAKASTLQHTTQSLAENIAMGQSSSGQAVRDWMNSPGHRANILNGSYTRVGAAGYTGPNGSTYWCLQLLW